MYHPYTFTLGKRTDSYSAVLSASAATPVSRALTQDEIQEQQGEFSVQSVSSPLVQPHSTERERRLQALFDLNGSTMKNHAGM